jgi:hypothetical protein
MRMRYLFLAVSVAVSVLATSAAHADAVDGHWCGANGKTFSIDGPNIVIPSGKAITGDYSRHGFRYVGPEGDPEEGQDIHMDLQSDDLLYLWRRIGGKDGPVENWRRCQVTS